METFNRYIAAATLLAAVTSSALAGDLDPPSGSIDATMKTLVEVEPRTIINADNTPGDADSIYKITAPGSYYLVSNITVILASSAIEVAADGVTIDLMGFQLRGIGAGTLEGVSAPAAVSNIHIRNGVITGFGNSAISLVQAGSASVENVRISDCGNGIVTIGGPTTILNCSISNCNFSGIWTFGAGSIVRDCVSNGNGTGTGIACGFDAVVTRCTAKNNAASGISIQSGSISHCAADGNATGFNCQEAGVIEHCSARENTDVGINVTRDNLVRDNVCHDNGPNGNAAGIYALDARNRIEGNHCTDNTFGIRINGADNFIAKNTCAANTTNFAIPATSVRGPIINATLGGDLASFAGADHPWANFSH